MELDKNIEKNKDNEDKINKKEQLEKDLILAEIEYDTLYNSINKRRTEYLKQEHEMLKKD